jgi:hypothetical protein
MTFDVNLTDGRSHKVALYSLDWDGGGARQQRFEVLDAATGSVLDSRVLSSFAGGVYEAWTLSGHVQIRVTNLNPAANAVVSGIFFG